MCLNAAMERIAIPCTRLVQRRKEGWHDVRKVPREDLPFLCHQLGQNSKYCCNTSPYIN